MSPRLLAPFLCLTLLPLIAPAWLSVRLLEQDRVVEAQRRQERFDRAIELAVTRVKQNQLSLQGQLRCAPPDGASGEGFFIVEMGSRGTRVCAGGPLMWVADPPAARQAPADLFSAGEALEFGKQDPLGAAAEYRKLVDSRDPVVRAGALLRIARVLKSAGRSEEALEAYLKMEDLHDAAAGGGPAALVARRARCELLAKLGRKAEARVEGAEPRPADRTYLGSRHLHHGPRRGYAHRQLAPQAAEPARRSSMDRQHPGARLSLRRIMLTVLSQTADDSLTTGFYCACRRLQW